MDCGLPNFIITSVKTVGRLKMTTPDKFSVPQTAVTEPVQPKPPHPTTPHTHGDGDGDSVHSYVCKFKAENGQWECVEYYKRQILQDVIDSAENNVDGRAAIDQLKDFGCVLMPHTTHHVMHFLFLPFDSWKLFALLTSSSTTDLTNQ